MVTVQCITLLTFFNTMATCCESVVITCSRDATLEAHLITADVVVF